MRVMIINVYCVLGTAACCDLTRTQAVPIVLRRSITKVKTYYPRIRFGWLISKESFFSNARKYALSKSANLILHIPSCRCVACGLVCEHGHSSVPDEYNCAVVIVIVVVLLRHRIAIIV